jgi:hypothetical protein
MKRLISIILGLSLALGTVSVGFAADGATKKQKKKKGKKKGHFAKKKTHVRL